MVLELFFVLWNQLIVGLIADELQTQTKKTVLGTLACLSEHKVNQWDTSAPSLYKHELF